MMTRNWMLVPALALAGTLFACGKKEEAKPAAEAAAPAAATAEAKIADAASAGFGTMAATAKIMDWDGTVLREGSGPYTCMPTEPKLLEAGLKSPMCMDAVWMEWAHAWEQHAPFSASAVGVSYMLGGDGGASNIDPYATAETPDNDWVVEGPHLMVLVPDPAWLEGISTDPHNGGPYVMWKGTPYAHVMVPVQVPPKAEGDDPVADALSAIHAELAGGAAVVDWEMKTLREGSNAYTCMPTPPMLEGTAPMCMDEPWMNWAHAWMTKGTPEVTRLGISYMLAGDEGSSNVDPYAEGPTPDNEWVVEGPHVMLLVPDASALEGMPTDPANGGAYVMWKGTPYAHVMVPIAD
jgi:hypothetical protein